jgi:hypothetical protein
MGDGRWQIANGPFVSLAVRANILNNLFIATPIMTEGREKFCFRETKKCDFWIFFNH